MKVCKLYLLQRKGESIDSYLVRNFLKVRKQMLFLILFSFCTFLNFFLGTLISRDFPRTYAATIMKIPVKATGFYTIQYDVEKFKGKTVKVKKREIEAMVAKYKLWSDFKIKRDKKERKKRKLCNRPIKIE